MAPGASQRLRLLVRDGGARLLFGLGLTRPGRAGADRLTVVTLHRVLPAEALASYPLPQIAVTPEELAWIVAFLRAHFTCDTLAGAHRRWREGERPARPLLALTFDDGQLDNFVHARPVLDAAGVKATFFVPVEAIDQGTPLWHDRLGFGMMRLLAADPPAARRLLGEVGVVPGPDARATAAAAVAGSKRLREEARRALAERVAEAVPGDPRPAWDGMMGWDQLRTLAQGGHEIGSHSVTHALLPGLDAVALEREAAGSRARIRAELGVACESFCYPNGDHDARVVEAVRRAGYRQAVLTAWGPNAAGADPLRLTRCDLQGRTVRDGVGRLSEEVLALRLSPAYARVRG